MKIREIKAKGIMTPSRIGGIDYCINPYVGCEHGCRYCYASFMKRFTGHAEKWGEFLDAKINAPELLEKELRKLEISRQDAAPPRWENSKSPEERRLASIAAGCLSCKTKKVVSLSTVTDPFQPAEEKYQLTRRCLELLINSGLSVTILTKSTLVLRDIDIIKQLKDCQVGMTITTDNEAIRSIFEPNASPIDDRLDTLRKFHDKGIKTYAFVGPILPQDPIKLAKKLDDFVDEVLIDKMNYSNKIIGLYRYYKFERFLEMEFFCHVVDQLRDYFGNKINIEVEF